METLLLDVHKSIEEESIQYILEDSIRCRNLLEAGIIFPNPELLHLALASVTYIRTEGRTREFSSLTGSLSVTLSVMLPNRGVPRLP